MTTRVLCAAILASLLFARSAAAQAPAQKPNILFIVVDDLNHWVGHLGRNPQVKTPNIDRLAQRGLTFTRAYCPAPVCNPSRAALMSGLRPSTTGCYDNRTDWRPLIDQSLTLPTHLRNNGYFIAGAGKIYHGGFDRRAEFDEYMTRPAGLREPKPTGSDGVGGIKFAPLDCRDDQLIDYHIANFCIQQLQRKHDKPIFLACGFTKPHMPWNVPQKYFDMYPLDKIQLPPVNEKDLDDVPPAGVRMAGPNGDHAKILASGRWKEAVQAYMAAISYCDMNVGRVLDAFEKSEYKDNTIIIFFGDHGWHLGEKQHWRKFALWEEATRAPFIWVVPGQTRPATTCARTVDFMCIYPTLCDLAGLPIPKHIEGISIKPLLSNPQAEWKTPALTTFQLNNHAVRTEQWRYIRYHDGGEELYDEIKDPLEWTNLASNAQTAATRAELSAFFPKVNKPAPARRVNVPD
ncbi:MAG TPA: sulfatase [Tepidisphaeraceae bacterium]|jgi:arylsulfatase A-like enzyme|nr:sulfatase [Tepidisphaeraceae bacterium]